MAVVIRVTGRSRPGAVLGGCMKLWSCIAVALVGACGGGLSEGCQLLDMPAALDRFPFPFRKRLRITRVHAAWFHKVVRAAAVGSVACLVVAMPDGDLNLGLHGSYLSTRAAGIKATTAGNTAPGRML